MCTQSVTIVCINMMYFDSSTMRCINSMWPIWYLFWNSQPPDIPGNQILRPWIGLSNAKRCLQSMSWRRRSSGLNVRRMHCNTDRHCSLCRNILCLLEQSQHECYCRTDACLITVTVNYTSTHCYSLKLFPNLASANGVLAVYTTILV